MSTSRPVIAVLCATVDDVPPHLEQLAGRAELRPTDEEGLAEAIAGADALLLWDFFSRAVQDVWPRADRLRWVHVAAAGVDTLLFEELRASDVVVTNARGIFDRPIAEFVLGAVLAHAKRVHESHDLQRERRWRHRETRRVQGARVMVVGTGAIGRETARLLRAVGMEVVAAGSRARPEPDPDLGPVVASADLADHVVDVDYLVNAAPLTPATHGLLDARVLAALPAHAHLVNVGRGATVVEEDLLAALRAGALDGATLDVFATEPLPPGSPLWDTPGVVVSAHMSGDVVGWRDALARQFVDNAARWLDGSPLLNVVDKQLGYVSTAGA
ncbi:D-2-hydroxyacid dehydrogenase [Ornithinimicrobium pekingense]|uniref:2-hydroxyacid dehydrogenase n=1 Tax=Ornithinimicrobium pekingense TaxID=384677 RepID=A0ABQ2FBV5_9MICO|nr:D-2-hydroxyacid dehydrogenase [Ornithinimicrobium pekingense]GGK72435.1 2-hydroxyacid dehydrogenase [Ornithinimicrobium pekingense]